MGGRWWWRRVTHTDDVKIKKNDVGNSLERQRGKDVLLRHTHTKRERDTHTQRDTSRYRHRDRDFEIKGDIIREIDGERGALRGSIV